MVKRMEYVTLWKDNEELRSNKQLGRKRNNLEDETNDVLSEMMMNEYVLSFSESLLSHQTKQCSEVSLFHLQNWKKMMNLRQNFQLFARFK